MIKLRENDPENAFEIVHVEHHSSQWIDRAADAHFKKIIMAMSVQIMLVPEGGLILLFRPARLVIAV